MLPLREFIEIQNVTPDINVKNIDTICVLINGNLNLFITKTRRIKISEEFMIAKINVIYFVFISL